MASLFDELREHGLITKDVPVIKCNTVESYLSVLNRDTTRDRKEVTLAHGSKHNALLLTKKDYPCVRPPFEECFFESKFDLEYNDDFGGRKWGAFITTRDTLVEAVFFIGLLPLAMSSQWKFNDFGTMQDAYPVYYGEEPDGSPNIRRDLLMSSYMSGTIWVTISFMHCKKQTKLIEHVPPEKVQRKRIKNNKPPLTKYYTLDIEPLKEILRTEGRVHEVGLPKALHICRGHFKDYSQGKGLFGKYKGLYWWDSHIRGNESAGTVIKDYAVKLPEVEGFN